MRARRRLVTARIGCLTGAERALWLAALITWGALAAATAGDARTREWVISLVAAAVATSSAISTSLVRGRIDRMYRALLESTTLQNAGNGQDRRRLSLVQTGPQKRL